MEEKGNEWVGLRKSMLQTYTEHGILSFLGLSIELFLCLPMAASFYLTEKGMKLLPLKFSFRQLFWERISLPERHSVLTEKRVCKVHLRKMSLQKLLH